MFFGTKRVLAAMFALVANVLLFCGTSYAISGTVDIQGQKVMNGQMELSGGEFTFELRKSGSNDVLMTTTNRADGSIVFEDVPYSDADIVNEKYVIYEVSEVRGDDETIVYDSNIGYVVVTLDEDTEEVANIDYAKPNSEDISYEDYEYQTYHASDEELQGVAYAVYDSRDKSLVFFRAEEGAYDNNQYVYLDGDEYLKYVVVPEDTVPGFHMDSFSGGWQVRSVRFKDAVRPMDISFESSSYCKSFDLRKLDTSRMTDMSEMFEYIREDNAVSSINISGFDTSDVTSMKYFFYDSQSIERVIWGHLDTSKVEGATGAFHTTKLEYFDFSRFDTTSLTDASDMFFSNTNNLNKIDVSTWKSNGNQASWDDFWHDVNNYNTQTFAGRYSGEYLDISSWGKTYSEEFYNMTKLKVFKICMPATAQRGTFILGNMINVETGEVRVDSRRLDACGTYVKLGYDSMEFTNRKKSSIEVQKTDADGNPLSGATLGLKMDGSIIYSWDTDGNAKVFHDLAFGHSYEVVELDAPAGYRKAEPISFEVDENGVVTSGGEVVSSITMADEEDKVEVEKIWDDEGFEQFRPESASFELVESFSGDVVEELTLTADDDWKGEFTNFSRYDIDDYENEYKVVEVNTPVNYEVSYAVDSGSEFSSSPIVSDTIVVKNTFAGETVERDFLKKWDDEGHETERPESVNFKLYEQSDMSKAVREVTLTADNADENDANIWRGVFEELPSLNSDGSVAKYVIVEDTLAGYETSYATLEGEDDIDILEFNCELLGGPGGGFLGIVTDVTNEESGTVSMRYFGLAGSNITRLSAESSNYKILISPYARCTGSVVRGSRDSLTMNYSESELDSNSYEDTFGNFTYEPVTRDDIFTAEPTGDMNRPNTFALNKEDYVPVVTNEQSEPFADANVIINRPISEEEVTPDTPETKDKIVKSVVILATTLSLGIGAFCVGGACKRSCQK